MGSLFWLQAPGFLLLMSSQGKQPVHFGLHDQKRQSGGRQSATRLSKLNSGSYPVPGHLGLFRCWPALQRQGFGRASGYTQAAANATVAVQFNHPTFQA